jgi:iron complex outermembrane receptor protein
VSAGLILLSLLLVTAAKGQEAPSPLDDLLNAHINAAAKYEQPVRDVPASVTIITAEEIERYGFETLGEVLNSVRGLYTSYDRNYMGIGVRGFGRLTDYNNRVLVLIDGHPISEPVFGTVSVGTDLVLNLNAVERIEIVRGPSSVMYGTGAMFGVVNIVMKTGDGTHTLSAIARAGSNGLSSASVRATTSIGATNIAMSGLLRSVAGKDLYFPQFATDGSDGIAHHRDYDRSVGILARITHGDFSATFDYGTRTKGVPGASYITNFNDNEWTIDRRKLIDLAYEHSMTPRLRVAVHAAWHRYDYDGSYPMSPTYFDNSLGETAALETRLAWDVRANDRLTVGVEATNAIHSQYRYWGNGEATIEGPFATVAGYLQNEYQPTSNLSITAGVRVEHNTAVGSWFNPRLAVVFNPWPSSTLKVLYGQAYRAPSVYELEAFADPNHQLNPEKVRTAEIVFEQKLSQSFAVFASAYTNKAEDLIEIKPTGNGGHEYQNDKNPLRANGVEMQLDYRAQSGVWGYASWSIARTTDNDSADFVDNAPRHLFKLGASTDPFKRAHGGIEMRYESSRMSLDGGRTSPFFIANATASLQLTKHLRAGMTVRNLFDRNYENPVGSEFRYPRMQQDGRTVEVMLHVTK